MASPDGWSPADSSTPGADASESPPPPERSTPEPVPPREATALGVSPRLPDETMHELRATLGGLAVASRLLTERGTRLPSGRRRRLQLMHDAEMSRLWRLVEGERQPLAAVDLDQVVFPLVEGLRLRGHEVRWLRNGTRATGRPDDVAEIVHVLLENAVRHAPGTPITIEPAGSAPGWTGLRVFDRGPGVSDATVPLLFERGGRGPRSPGLGLGLHVARRLAAEMGGSLVLEPASHGRGASFCLTLSTEPARVDGT